jgi:hypothetical protein
MTIDSNKKKDGLRTVLFVASLIAFLFTLLGAAASFAGGTFFTPSLGFTSQDRDLFFTIGFLGLAFAGFHFWAMLNAFRKPKPQTHVEGKRPLWFLVLSIVLVVWAIILLLDYLGIITNVLIPLYPMLTPLAVGIPILWIIAFGKRKITPVSTRRKAAALSIGTSYNMLFIIFIEFIVLAIIAAAFLIYAATQPQYQQLLKMFSLPEAFAQVNDAMLERYVRVILQNPLILATVFVSIGVLIPFIEEALKPVTLWFLRKRSVKQEQGFVMGLYFGAAFAFLESSGMVLQFSSDGSWAESILLRAATSVLHITCSGLVGYGYARAMQPNSKNGVAKPLLLAVLLHGSWNSLAVLSAINTLSIELNIPNTLPSLDILFTVLLIVLWVVVMYILWKMNGKMQKLSKQNFHNEIADDGVPIDDVE